MRAVACAAVRDFCAPRATDWPDRPRRFIKEISDRFSFGNTPYKPYYLDCLGLYLLPLLLALRPFIAISSIFSDCVPPIKCLGLQQDGLSQVCKKTGYQPYARVPTIRCTYCVTPGHTRTPYPSLLAANHGWHASKPPLRSIKVASLSANVRPFLQTCFPTDPPKRKTPGAIPNPERRHHPFPQTDQGREVVRNR